MMVPKQGIDCYFQSIGKSFWLPTLTINQPSSNQAFELFSTPQTVLHNLLILLNTFGKLANANLFVHTMSN